MKNHIKAAVKVGVSGQMSKRGADQFGKLLGEAAYKLASAVFWASVLYVVRWW